MKKFIVIVLMTGTFLGGYYLGRLPGSPDMFGWMSRTAQRMQTVRGESTRHARASLGSRSRTVRDQAHSAGQAAGAIASVQAFVHHLTASDQE